jgi:hypothetical protein
MANTPVAKSPHAANTAKQEDEPEEAEAVQRGDRALRGDPVHRPEPRQNIRAEAKQPGDIAQDKMDPEQGFGGHLVSFRHRHGRE